jgi:hypothetical protein
LCSDVKNLKKPCHSFLHLFIVFFLYFIFRKDAPANSAYGKIDIIPPEYVKTDLELTPKVTTVVSTLPELF